MNSNVRLTIIAVLLLTVAALAAFILLPSKGGCGNAVCDPGEDMAHCAIDCPGSCGDRICDHARESAADCPADCTAVVCGDGTCVPGEASTCPRDCAPPTGSAAGDVAPAAAADALGTTTAVPPTTVAPGLPVRCGDGKCDAGEGGAACPADCQPPGQCRDPAFRKIVAEVVRQCAAGCSFESKNPVVTISEGQFRALFAHASDDGIGVYFAVFGCNVWRKDRQDCWGYDAAYAEPGQCPPDANYECATRSDGPQCTPTGAQGRCKQYASAIEAGVRAFVTKWRTAPHLLLLGTASRSGNTRSPDGAEVMHLKNRDLALLRSSNVEGLIDRMRAELEKADTPILARTYKVVLDNTRQFFDSPGFVKLVGAQMRAAPLDPGFKPTSDNAVNRSVMLIAVACDLTDEGIETAR